jgi:hypothetical protein
MLKSVTLALLAIWLVATPASAQVDAQIRDLNRQALDAYQALDIDGARTQLERAIKLAQKHQFSGPTVAQSYLALGLVYVAGMSDQEQGLAAFVNAICIQHDVQLDPLLSTPTVKQVFAQARKDADAGACGPGAGTPAAPLVAAVPQATRTAEPDLTVPDDGSYAAAETDTECPPGMVCSGSEGAGSRADKGFAKFFASVQLVAGFSMLRSGMEADSKPPRLVAPTGEAMAPSDVFRREEMVYNNETMMYEDRFLFNEASPWVPDADSYDDYENAMEMVARGTSPLSDNCSADGVKTGPVGVPDASGVPYTTLEPSKYCVRVATPGIATAMALRANIGYFLTDSFALSIPFRLQFEAGEGTLSNILVGLRGELMFSPPKAPTGTAVSWFFGATYGQIQARPQPPPDSDVEGPYAISGPLGLHTGLNVRVRLHRNFGVIISPEVDVLLPDLLVHGDLSAGIETAF